MLREIRGVAKTKVPVKPSDEQRLHYFISEQEDAQSRMVNLFRVNDYHKYLWRER